MRAPRGRPRNGAVGEADGVIDQPDRLLAELTGTFDLAVDKPQGDHTFDIHSWYGHYSPTGVRLSSEDLTIRIRCGATADVPVTCLEAKLSVNDAPAVAIAELTDWSYHFDSTITGADARGPLWGIPHDRFSALTDGQGNPLPFSLRYAAYTALIDFHSINDEFGRPSPFGPGLQDLTAIGQRVVHPASFVAAQMHFGTEVRPGSTFKNGQVTLDLVEMSIVGQAVCAVVEYDAGESTLKMIIDPGGGQTSVIEGGSQYQGLMYLDLTSGWARRATLEEYMIAKVTTGDLAEPSIDYTTCHIELRMRDGLAWPRDGRGPVQSDCSPALIGGHSAGHQSPCGSVVCPTSMM